MASKLAKKNPASTKASSSKTSTTKPNEPAVTILKRSTADNLSQSGEIGYEISVDNAGMIFFGLTSNSGAGFFSD